MNKILLTIVGVVSLTALSQAQSASSITLSGLPEGMDGTYTSSDVFVGLPSYTPHGKYYGLSTSPDENGDGIPDVWVWLRDGTWFHYQGPEFQVFNTSPADGFATEWFYKYMEDETGMPLDGYPLQISLGDNWAISVGDIGFGPGYAGGLQPNGDGDSSSTLEDQAATLNDGLTFQDGQWTPDQ